MGAAPLNEAAEAPAELDLHPVRSADPRTDFRAWSRFRLPVPSPTTEALDAILYSHSSGSCNHETSIFELCQGPAAAARRQYNQANGITRSQQRRNAVIVQPSLEVPANIAAGIASGKYIRIGGVVRNALSGRIVAHLKEAAGAESSQKAMGRAAAILRSRGAVVASVALGTLAAGATTFVVVNKRKQAGRREIPECVANLNVSLRTYLEAGREGGLDASIVSRLISDLDAVKAYSDNNNIAVDFSTGLWEALVNLVVDHTRKLAEAYSLELDQLQGEVAVSGNGSVIVLRRHLEIQRHILAGAA